MMKSFFKKLAFVMALAMVVTLAAPAGFTASAAEALGIALQTAKSDAEVVASYNVAVDETVDFKFYGAPKNWKEIGLTWTTDNAAVATVDQTGKITGESDGVATITLASADGAYVGSIAITVGTGVVPPAIVTYTATQKSEITFDVNFSTPVEYGRDDVELYRIFDTDEGPAYVVWAVRDAKLNDEGTTLTVEPYVQFGDGDKYLVKVGDNTEGYEFTTYLGEVTHVTFEWASLEKKYTAYTAGEDADSDIEITLKAKLWSGTVDLTNYYKNEGYVEYAVLEESDPDFYSIADDVLVITKAGEWVKVQATYVYEDATGEEKKAYSDAELIQAIQVPDYAIEYIVDWGIVYNGQTIDWSNPTKTVAAGKEGYKVAVLLKDNRGGLWSSYASYKGNDDIDGVFGEECADDTAEHLDMFLQFYSTNTDKFLVDTDGTLKTYTQMKNAVVYVALHDNGRLEEDFDTTFVRNIGAFAMEIGKPSQLDEVVITTQNKGRYDWSAGSATNNISLVTDAVVDLEDTDHFIDELTKKTLYLWNVDQYGQVYDETADTVVTNTTVDFTITTSNKDIKELIDEGVADALIRVNYSAGGTGTVFVDAMALNEETAKSSVTFVITATQYDKVMNVVDTAKVSLKVALKDPELYDEDDEDMPENRNIGDVKVTSWSLDAGNANLDVFNDDGYSASKITVPMLSKSYVVGYYNRYNMDSVSGDERNPIQIVATASAYAFKSGAIETPGIYVIVTDPNGNVVKPAVNGGLGVWLDEEGYAVKVNVAADNNGDTVIDYMPTGKYTVKTTFVTSTKDENGKVEYKTRTDNFTVTDNIVRPSFTDMYEVETEYTLDDSKTKAELLPTIKEIIKECYQFYFDEDHDGGYDWPEDEWIPTSAEIYDVNFLVKGEYLLVKSITFRLPTGKDGVVYEYTLKDINRSVRLGVEMD